MIPRNHSFSVIYFLKMHTKHGQLNFPSFRINGKVNPTKHFLRVKDELLLSTPPSCFLHHFWIFFLPFGLIILGVKIYHHSRIQFYISDQSFWMPKRNVRKNLKCRKQHPQRWSIGSILHGRCEHKSHTRWTTEVPKVKLIEANG